MKIYNQTAITNSNYQKNTVRKHNITPNFKAWISIPGGLNHKESSPTLGKLFNKEKFTQLFAKAMTVLGLINAANNNNTITQEERKKLKEYLKQYGFSERDINKKVNVRYVMLTPLIYACKYEKTDIVKILLKYPDIDVNIQYNNGNTALTKATYLGNTEIVKALLNHPNIDVNMQNKEGLTALLLAADKGNVEGLKALLENPNIDVNIQDNNDNTALTKATYLGNTEIVKALLENPNIDVNIQNKEGFTALIWAASRGNTEIVKALLNHPNIDVNIQNKYGNTALMWAADKEYVNGAKALLENPNIDVNIQNNDGNTALIRAADCKRTETVKALLEIDNIDINIQNNKGKTAMVYMPKIAQWKKEIDKRKAKEVQEAKETIEAQEKFEAFGFTDIDYFDLSTYEKVLDSGLSPKQIEKLFNEKQNSNEDSLLSYLAGNPFMQDENSQKRLEKILEKMEKLNINYNQKDRFGISALENIMNSSNIVFLRHYIKKNATTDYYPGLDVAYKSIQSADFKKLLDEHIYDVVNFKDVRDAIKSQSEKAMTAVNYQMHSPFFDYVKQMHQ